MTSIVIYTERDDIKELTYRIVEAASEMASNVQVLEQTTNRVLISVEYSNDNN